MPQTGDRPRPGDARFTRLMGTILTAVSIFSSTPVTNEVAPSVAFATGGEAGGAATCRTEDLRSVLSEAAPTYEDVIQKLANLATIH